MFVAHYMLLAVRQSAICLEGAPQENEEAVYIRILGGTPSEEQVRAFADGAAEIRQASEFFPVPLLHMENRWAVVECSIGWGYLFKSGENWEILRRLEVSQEELERIDKEELEEIQF